ncbi:MAG: polysaccharide biosynthesis tyrosine autokinase [Verrucomicrobia bacterium]|nr:polysaccharide biosynthesis tyrosine autokinase [Verrucomicrobiota bacterium]
MDAAPQLTDPAPTTTENRLHFLDYWRIIRMRGLLIFVVFALVVGTTAVLTHLMEPTYMSTVRMEVQKDVGDISSLMPQQQQGGFDPYFVMTQFEILQSKEVLYKVIDDLKLVQRWDQKYRLGLSKPKAYQVLTKLIDPRQVRNTSIIEINVYSKDKEEAAEIANKIADIYKSSRDDQRKRLGQQGLKVLRERAAEQASLVGSAETNVNHILKEKGLNVIAENGGGIMSLETDTIRSLEQQLIEIRGIYTKKETIFQELRKVKPEQLKNALGPPIVNDEILSRRLEEHSAAEKEFVSKSKDLGPLNPDYVRMQAVIVKLNQQVDDRVNGIMLGLETDLKAQAAALTLTEAKLEEAKIRNRAAGEKNRSYQMAISHLEDLKRLLATMQAKIILEASDVEMTRSTAVQVTDHAEPAIKAAYPKMTLNVALGAFVGIILGIGLAFFIEYLDTSVKTIDDVERALQAPVLAVIPQNVGALLDEGTDSPHAEAYRVLRTNILFTRKDDKANAITVVSGGAGEGKSTTVLNLATIFAQNGNKVLLVDSDLRRPSLHKRLGLSNSLGLTNYLLGQNKLEEVIQHSALANLHFLPSGRLPSSALGILNSPQMKDFIKEAKSRYDFVFFDAPPIMGVSDATVLASGADLAILVIQYRKYPQSLAIRSRQMVEKVGGRLIGVVLNNINLASDASYYYYSGYNYRSNNNADEPGANGKPPGKADRHKPAAPAADSPAIKPKY